MSENLDLCKCLFCLKNYPNGNFVTKSVFYRHRKRNQMSIEEESSNSEQEENVKEKDINLNLKNNEVGIINYNLLNILFFIYYIILINKI